MFSVVSFILPLFSVVSNGTKYAPIGQLMEYSHLLDRADECEDPYMRLVYAGNCPLYFHLINPCKCCLVDD